MMFLNEFIKEHKKVEQLQATVAQLTEGKCRRLDGSAQRAGRANPESQRAARNEQACAASSRKQALKLQ